MEAATTNGMPKGRILYSGCSYYNTWYLSRELRQRGWVADVLDWDINTANAHLYHGEDFRLIGMRKRNLPGHLNFYLRALRGYDIFHFSGMHGIRFSHLLHKFFTDHFRQGDEIRLL